jgi:NAD(P)-dependent dehydrogenase (short-subunit alcohol dehydrogenase family)
MRLEGKVAIVTGAGTAGPGIGNGKAAAILYAREGARVMVVDTNLEAAEETKHLIDKEGGSCTAFSADVSEPEDCKKIADKCFHTFHRIDILHNNVGILGMGGVIETSEETWDKVMKVNLKSMFLTCKHVIPYMEKQGGGAIINISSVNAVRRTQFPSLVYSVTKAGVHALTREIAVQYAAKGIRANVIIPGFIDTPLMRVAVTEAHARDVDEVIKKRVAIIPIHRLGDAWDIAYTALFLASEEAKYITGTTLVVDGGLIQTIST